MKRCITYPAWAVFLLSLAVCGCMRLGPEYRRPDTGIRIPGHFHSASGVQTAGYVKQAGWWETFGAPGLDRVVRAVIENNPEIAKAAAAVMEARALVRQTGADRFPAVNLDAQAARQKQAIANPLTGEITSYRTDSFSLSVPASFEVDLWGRLARASQAARADLLAAEENRRTVVQSLVAETVNLYLQFRFLERRIEIAQRLVESYEQNLELVEARYRRGLSSVLDVRQARRSLARAEAEIPSLVESRGRALHSLSVLQGKYPQITDDEDTGRWMLETPPPVPAGMPAELLSRRPDIRAAEASLKAACARIGAARAARFPRISLTGSFGYSSEELSALLDPASQLWKLAAGSVQPVFDAGKRAAAEEAARARYRQQEAAYAKTVLAAFAEVEDALFARRQLLDRQRRLVRLVKESEATLETALDRYQRGLVAYLNVLDARQALYQAELDLVQAQYALWSNRVQLHRVLGGGWDRID